MTALYDEFGFDTVNVGPLAESWRVERDQPAYVVRQTRDELVENLAEGHALTSRASLSTGMTGARRERAYGGPVGTIYYGGSATPIHIDDRALAHLKVVIATKLRRSESFTVTWRHPEDQPRGRSTIWLHPSIPLRFVFDDPEPTELSRDWIEELASSANSSGGITLVAEHFDTGPIDVIESEEPHLTVGKVDVDELSIDKLTVAGTEMIPGEAPAAPNVLETSEVPIQPED